MRSFIRTFLVVVCLLGVIATPVRAQTPTPVPFIVPPGGIAIIGFNADAPDEFSFVCLTEIPDGANIRFTDKGWTENNNFYEFESIFTWLTPSGCKVGQIVNINLTDSANIPNISGDLPFDLTTSSGDQIIIYQQIGLNLNFIFAINFRYTNWQTNGNDKFSSIRPPGLDATNSVAINEIDNSIHTGGQEFDFPATVFDSPSLALASIVDKTHWKGSNDTRQTMPFGFFSFKTTAVEVNEFKADTNGVSTPWFVIVGLVVIPTLVMVWKKPKRNCCQ
jgi:hypothetical protein